MTSLALMGKPCAHRRDDSGYPCRVLQRTGILKFFFSKETYEASAGGGKETCRVTPLSASSQLLILSSAKTFCFLLSFLALHHAHTPVCLADLVSDKAL